MADDKLQLPEGYEDAKSVKQQTGANAEGLQLPEGFEDAKPVEKPKTPPVTDTVTAGKNDNLWDKVNKPLLSQPIIEKHATEYAEAGPTLAESEHPTRTAFKKGFAGALGSIEKMGREMSSPLGIATLAAGPIIEGAGEAVPAAKELAESVPYLKPALKYGQRALGLGFGAQGLRGAEQGVEQAVKEGGVTPQTSEQILGGAGFGALGVAGGLHDTKVGTQPIQKTAAAPIRAASRLGKPLSHIVPSVGGIIAASEAGIPHPFIVGGTVGRFILPPAMLERMFDAGRTLGLNKEEANIIHLQGRYDDAVHEAKEPQKAWESHEAGRQQGIPAPADVVKAHADAQAAVQEAEAHLKAAQKDYADKMASKGVPVEEPITPEAVEAARPSPTDEELKARQEKLMGQIEEKAGIEQSKPTPENVKLPGQVQPETFPQEPTEAPKVDESARMRPLAGGQGTMGRRLALPAMREPEQMGLPLEEPAPEAPKKPLGEVLPPEKRASAAEMAGLKPVGGRVIEAPDKAVAPLVQEGLKRGTEEAKPIAVPPKKFEEVLPKHEEIAETAEEPKKETAEEPKTAPEEIKPAAELTDEQRRQFEHRVGTSNTDLLDSPEGLEIARKLIKGTNKQFADLANNVGIKGGTGEDGAWKPEDFKRSRAEHGSALNPNKEKVINALRKQFPGTSSFLEATKEFGPTVEEYGTASGGKDTHEETVKAGGGVFRGVQEGVPSANLKGLVLFDHPETGSTLAIPEDEINPDKVREKLEAHKEVWDKAKMTPIPETEEDLKAEVSNPFHILGQEEAAQSKAEAPTPKVNPVPAESRAPIDRTKVQGGDEAQPHNNYHEASQQEGNPWVRRSVDPANDASPTNEKRTLMVQFASELLQKEAMNDDAKNYYDKLYSGAREGYARMRDFWETPQWMGFASHMLPDADVYVVRDMEQAKSFLNSAKYGNVLFSALDVNAPFISDLAKGYDGQFDVGGYTKPESFAEAKNITWHNSMEDFAKAKGIEYKNGVDYRHFEGSDVIPRLTLSDGCLHKCAFCIVEKAIKETPSDVVNQQADAIAAMKSKLVYLNDKTFGQAPNYKTLPDLYERMKAKNPDFQGFVVQTTAAQMNKLTPEFLKKSGIKFAEIGVETYNDKLLKELHKPATESLIDKAMGKLKDAGIAAIPNIIIGMPGEDAATYAHTLEFLRKNQKNISHANVYNLAIYKDSELGQKLATGAGEASDFDENVLHKSFHTDPQVHSTFAGDLYDLGEKLLGKKVGEPIGAVQGGLEGESDAEMARRGANVPAPDKTLPGQEKGPKGFPDYKEVAEYHNKNRGFTYNMAEGFMKDKPGFSVAGEHPELEKVLPHSLKTDDIQQYVEDPKVKDALEQRDENSIGGYRYKGKSILEVSRLYKDKAEAIEAAKKLNQESIYDHAAHDTIPTGGTAADEALAKAETEEKPLKPYKDMTPAEQEALAAKGVSGGSQEANKKTSKLYKDMTPEEKEAIASMGTSGGAASATGEAKLPPLAEQHLLPEEKQGVTKSKQQLSRFLDRMIAMPKVREFTDAALKGAGERKWYQRSTQAFDTMVKEAPNYFDQPGDRDKFIGLLSAGSPQQAVVENMKEALRVWTNYVDNGRPTGEALEKLLGKSKVEGGFTLPEAKIPNAMKALAGEPLWPDITKNKNFKVPSFRDNLAGMMKRVTNDGWMALFSGLEAKDIYSAHSYHPISVMTRAAADELGWEPAEAQAAIWAFIKTLTEQGKYAAEDPHEMRQYSEDFADIILNDPQTRALLKDMGVDHAKLDERLAREVEEKPEPDTSRTSPTSEDSTRRAVKRVEAARGKGAIPPPKTGLLKFGEPEAEGRGKARGADEATSFNPEDFESKATPKQITKNASGESSASQEAINRTKSEKRSGTKYYRVDSRSGRETPIIGTDAADATAGPYEHIVRRGPDGEVTLDSGKSARPLGFIKRR